MSTWARLRGASRRWKAQLDEDKACFSHLALSLGIPLEPKGGLLQRLVATERLSSPRFTPPPAKVRWTTPEGGGIWVLEYHPLSGLIFAGLWGASNLDVPDHIKCWDAQTGSVGGSLYGHAREVKCLKASGPLLYSGSFDGTVRSWDVPTMSSKRVYVTDKPVLAVEATSSKPATAGE